jgi:hypothetical protein
MVTRAPTPRETFAAALACDRALDLDIRQAVPADGQARIEAAEALRRAGLLPRAADRLLDSPAGAQMARTAAERVRTGDHWRHALVHAAGRAVAAVRRAEGVRA